MKKQNMNKFGLGRIMCTALVLLGLGASWVQAQDIKINTRPLTARESGEYGLAPGTQIANGTHVVGLGQPVYLELFIEKDTVVTQVVWNIDDVIDEDNDSISGTSSAMLLDSPLTNDVPIYDTIDRINFDVVDRAVIYPDVKGTYLISAQAYTTNGMVEADLSVVGSVFVGKDNYLCVLCHTTKMDDFNETRHATAFEGLINGVDSSHFQEFCIKCHTTGYDAAPLAINGGFDDVADDTGWTFPTNHYPESTNNWDLMSSSLQAKANIQCESCHGPADEHVQSLGETGKIAVSLSAGNCGQCHDAPGHHVKNFEWGTALHARTEVDRTGSCTSCHNTKGFIDARDPGMNEFGEIVPTGGTANEGITCVACHDPHGAGGQPHQLRDFQSIELENGEVITEGGAGLVCMQCHKARRDAETYVFGRLSTHFGPHHGPQTDMLAGENAIEYGQDMPSSKHLTVIDDSCTECHLQDTQGMDLPEYAENRVGGHSFMLKFDDGTNDVIHLTQACADCHGELEDFNFGGEDYDRDGMVEGVQQEIADLLYELGMLLPPLGDPHIGLHDSTAGYDPIEYRRAVYNYLFVEEDGSHGVHNPKYAASILRASIDDLTGGIDIDRDGLRDEWEIAHFGNITSQSGSDDYDGDGLTNEQEENIGTDPMLVDTDGDNISDLAEIQGGSNPLDIDSVPTSDMVILPAAEVGYMPKGSNTMVQFQVIENLSDGSWEDIGSVQTNNGTGWIYQLDSHRGATNRFYRATED